MKSDSEVLLSRMGMPSGALMEKANLTGPPCWPKKMRKGRYCPASRVYVVVADVPRVARAAALPLFQPLWACCPSHRKTMSSGFVRLKV